MKTKKPIPEKQMFSRTVGEETVDNLNIEVDV